MAQHILLGDIAPLLLLLSLSRVIMRPATRRLTAFERRLGPLASPAALIALWHLSFFCAGVAVWWPLIQPVPMRRRLTELAPFRYIFAAKIGLAALGIYLTWSTVVAYTYYEHVPRIWGLSAVDDQNVGGALMLVEQSIVLLTALIVLFVRMLAQSEEEERRRERLEDAAPA